MKKSLTNNIKLKLLALLFAFLLWLIVVNIDNPVTDRVFRGIPVTVEHEEVITQAQEKKTYQIVDDTQTISVTVSAKRRELDKISEEDIVATADMKELYLDSQIPIQVKINGFDYENAVPNPRNLQVKIEDNASKTLPITPTTTGTVRDGYILGELTVNPEKVTINGAESVISTISKITAEVDVSGLSQSASLESSLVFYDADNAVVDQSMLGNNLGNVGVSVNVNVLSTKSIPVQIDTSGVKAASGYSIADIEYAPQEIRLAGQKEVLDAVTSVQIPAEALEEEPFSKKSDLTVDVSPYLPEGTQLADANENSIIVTISVEKDGTKSFNLPVGSIAVNNLEEGLKMSFVGTDDLEVHVQGAKDLLDTISIEHAASIDLKGLTEVGEYDVPVKIDIPSGCTLDGSVTLAVKLEKKQ